MTKNIEEWENEGGAVSEGDPASLRGTESQVEWAVRIRRKVNKEFDQVAAAFRSVADRQTGDKRANTEAMLSILEDKRVEVMSINRAGYFIRYWQEITDQVRQLILHDRRYRAIKSGSSESSVGSGRFVGR